MSKDGGTTALLFGTAIIVGQLSSLCLSMSISRSSLSPSYLLFLFFFIISLLLLKVRLKRSTYLWKDKWYASSPKICVIAAFLAPSYMIWI